MRKRIAAAVLAAAALAGGIVPAIATAGSSAPVASSQATWMHG